jgi:hypothetical protein
MNYFYAIHIVFDSYVYSFVIYLQLFKVIDIKIVEVNLDVSSR